MSARDEVQDRNRSVFERASGGIDCILISNVEPGDRNFFALTGAVGRFVYSMAVVFPDGSCRLLVDQLEEQEAIASGRDYSIYSPGRPSGELAKALRGPRVGVNSEILPLVVADTVRSLGLELVDVSQELRALRMVKTPRELACIREACEIVASVAVKIPHLPIRAGISECELQAEIDYLMTKQGSEQPAFPTLVAFGANSASPHHVSGATELQEGDLVMVDFGATVGNLVSDITRTYCFGTPMPWQRGLYSTVLKAQLGALGGMLAGCNAADMFRQAVATIETYAGESGGPARMTHALGHSIGYFLHDGARLSDADFDLLEGLVTTVEPGGYIFGVGGVRIEDDVLVLQSSAECLTSSAPKEELISLGA